MITGVLMQLDTDTLLECIEQGNDELAQCIEETVGMLKDHAERAVRAGKDPGCSSSLDAAEVAECKKGVYDYFLASVLAVTGRGVVCEVHFRGRLCARCNLNFNLL